MVHKNFISYIESFGPCDFYLTDGLLVSGWEFPFGNNKCHCGLQIIK